MSTMQTKPTITSSAQDAGQKNRVTIERIEKAKFGTRGEYILDEKSKCRPFAEKLGITCWVEKRRSDVGALRGFIDLPTDYRNIYGITYNGKDHDCGDMPRDMGKVILGIAIANNL